MTIARTGGHLLVLAGRAARCVVDLETGAEAAEARGLERACLARNPKAFRVAALLEPLRLRRFRLMINA